MNYFSDGQNNWYFIHLSKNNEPIKIYLKDSISQMPLEKPTNVLQIIAESIINDADELKQKYLLQINRHIKQTLLDSISELSSEAIEKEYGQYFERAGVFFNTEKELSDVDIQKLLNETRLLNIEIELFPHDEDGVVCLCLGNLIDPFMRKWICAMEDKYNNSEGFIENG